MSDDIRWIRSYVMEEKSGDLETVCIYQASRSGSAIACPGRIRKQSSGMSLKTSLARERIR